MFFKKTTLPKLEKRLLDSYGRFEALKERKEELLSDVLLAQEEGKDVSPIQSQIADAKSAMELCEIEIAKVKGDIIEFHRKEIEKDLAAFPEREAAFRSRLAELVSEGNKTFNRALQIFAALGWQHAPEGMSDLLGRVRVSDTDLAIFMHERSDLVGLRSLNGRVDQVTLNQRVARCGNRIGIRIMEVKK